MALLRALWAAWTTVARRIGDFQARLFLTIFYVFVLGPFAVGLKLLADPLRLGPNGAGGWTPRPRPEGDASTSARRQF